MAGWSVGKEVVMSHTGRENMYMHMSKAGGV